MKTGFRLFLIRIEICPECLNNFDDLLPNATLGGHLLIRRKPFGCPSHEVGKLTSLVRVRNTVFPEVFVKPYAKPRPIMFRRPPPFPPGKR